jgi:hypothetical protein
MSGDRGRRAPGKRVAARRTAAKATGLYAGAGLGLLEGVAVCWVGGPCDRAPFRPAGQAPGTGQ